jgi:glycerol-3-phosphate responsive antiterminator
MHPKQLPQNVVAIASLFIIDSNSLFTTTEKVKNIDDPSVGYLPVKIAIIITQLL